MEETLVLDKPPDSCKPIVVAIGIGAGYSEVAFAYHVEPNTIKYGAPSMVDARQTRVPTVLLELANDKWEFGNAALEKYSDLLAESDGEIPQGNLYKKFIAILNGKSSGFDTLTATSVTGKPHSLMNLMAKTLQFLQEYAISEVRAGFGKGANPHSDVQWVLTVPTWRNDFGKAFMRKAAYKAGMIDDELSNNLMFVVEPEGASVAVHLGSPHHNLLSKENRFIVLDCGGSMIDITVHEVQLVRPLVLKDIAPRSGVDWGAEKVNHEFSRFLHEFLGPEFYRPNENPYECHMLNKEFDKVKIVFDPSHDPPNLRGLADFLDHRQQLVEHAAAWNAKHPDKPILQNRSVLKNGYLPMSKELMLSFFEPFLYATTECIRTLLRSCAGVRHIVVVGDYGANKVVQNRLLTEFHGKDGLQVIVCDVKPKPQKAVLDGAVLCGLHRDQIGLLNHNSQLPQEQAQTKSEDTELQRAIVAATARMEAEVVAPLRTQVQSLQARVEAMERQNETLMAEVLRRLPPLPPLEGDTGAQKGQGEGEEGDDPSFYDPVYVENLK